MEGNLSKTAELTLTIDTHAPRLTVTAPLDGLLTNLPALTITGSVDEASAVAINGNVISMGANHGFEAAVTLLEGDNTIRITATDKAGNTTARSLRATL